MFGLSILRVTGRSMEPVIPQQSFILVSNWFKFLPVKQGQQLLIDHPEYGVIVKTVAAVDKYGFIWTRGENSASVSVEKLGPVSKAQIKGRVLYTITPKLPRSPFFN